MISGSYDEQKTEATDDFVTLDIYSDGSISFFSLDYMTEEDSSGYITAYISNLSEKSEGVYTFTAVNGDSPLSGTKFTYYSSGTSVSDLPFSSSFFDTAGGSLTRAVIVDNNNTVYK